jgi:hypothetical protein
MRRMTRIRLIPLTFALTLCLGLAAAAFATAVNSYAGKSKAGAVSFDQSPKGAYVVRFRFVNRCPSDSVKGTLVPFRMRVRSNGAFGHNGKEYKITGRFTSKGTAAGTAQVITGDCNSGVLKWTAKPTSKND